MSEKMAKENVQCITGASKSSYFPFKMVLTMDAMRWDSLKIDPSTEFAEKLLKKMPANTFEALQKWQPIEVMLHDVDTDENYSVELLKKEAFWFEPLPDIGPKVPTSDVVKVEKSGNEVKEYSYCLQPFRQVIKKRSLGYDQVIGLAWSKGENGDKIEFSVLYVPRFGSLISLRRQG